MFSVYGDQGTRQHGFVTKDDAIQWARETRKLTSFEIINNDDRVVYQEFPEPVWA